MWIYSSYFRPFQKIQQHLIHPSIPLPSTVAWNPLQFTGTAGGEEAPSIRRKGKERSINHLSFRSRKALHVFLPQGLPPAGQKQHKECCVDFFKASDASLMSCRKLPAHLLNQLIRSMQKIPWIQGCLRNLMGQPFASKACAFPW